MIKNIVLDMGNVLLDYNPDYILNLYLDSADDKKIIRKELFEGPEWIQADFGYITNEEKFEGCSKRVPERLHEKLKLCIADWSLCMLPVKGAKEFCACIKKKGYQIYVLSNAGFDFYQYFPKQFDLDFFDGIVVSADLHMVKPDPNIYRYLLEKYKLAADECLFIDDRQDNVDGAKSVGMHTHLFRDDFEKILSIYSHKSAS